MPADHDLVHSPEYLSASVRPPHEAPARWQLELAIAARQVQPQIRSVLPLVWARHLGAQSLIHCACAVWFLVVTVKGSSGVFDVLPPGVQVFLKRAVPQKPRSAIGS